MSRQMRLGGASGKLELQDPKKQPQSVLFVCLGNVIRSPLCEGLLKKHAKGKLVIDSAATFNYNIGEQPAENAQKLARMHGFDISGHRARKIGKNDFAKYDLIVSLEPYVKRRLDQMKPPNSRATVVEFVPGTKIANPWGLPLPDFVSMYAQIEAGMHAFIATYFPTLAQAE